MQGAHVRVSKLDCAADLTDLYDRIGAPVHHHLWQFIPAGPFGSCGEMEAFFRRRAETDGWITHMFRDPSSGAALGTASYMRVRPDMGSAEIGCVIFSERLKRTPAATEAMFLMARHIFDDLGYRRYEWKCDNGNASSKRAAERLGFSFEGVFRQDMVVKGRNRDTAWYSMLDGDWPRLKSAFEIWLASDNFTDGRQKRALAQIRGEARA